MLPGTRVSSTQARREAMISSVLSPAQREQLHGLLRQLMRAFPDKAKKNFAGASQSE